MCQVMKKASQMRLNDHIEDPGEEEETMQDNEITGVTDENDEMIPGDPVEEAEGELEGNSIEQHARETENNLDNEANDFDNTAEAFDGTANDIEETTTETPLQETERQLRDQNQP